MTRSSLALFLTLSTLAAQTPLPSPLPSAQPPVVVRVDANQSQGPYHPIWNYFGADEPNFTYSPNGERLLSELSRIAPATPVYFRPHNLLTTGNGDGSLKWGSTNVYTEDSAGKPIYNWIITDRLFDNLVANHIRPFVELGFTPEALSPHPTPYRHDFPKGDVFTGWSYPPDNDAKWRALIVAYATHLHDRYGARTDTWQWEVWNEPDINYFRGTPQQYLRLYDITTAAIRQVLPHALVGGPAVTGGGENKNFLRLFLEHCARGQNADTHHIGAPLDFISFHPKGSPKFLPANATTPAHVRMNLSRQLSATDRGFQIIASFPEYRQTPIILSETDPEGCAACQGPQNGYRNGPLYGVSVAEMLVRSAQLARLRGVNLAGAVTWAFEFENQPPFAGFRELATNAPTAGLASPSGGAAGLIAKPVLNVFRIFGLLASSSDQTHYVSLTSSSAIPLAQLTSTQVLNTPDIDGIALRSAHSISILLFHYHDEDLPAPAAALTLQIAGLPQTSAIHLTHYRMDQTHSNAYTAWLALGSPQTLTPQQLTALQAVSGLQPLETRTLNPTSAPVTLTTTLPRQAVTLYQLTW